ncbi:Mitotic checkpoint serine/threonine-protein kinase BUB1 [Portunus trituberculatus]|uniref:Mitotic checkpoint serine/threonine-protein kinase BUB1 n=1 Tax=Portunus trituberculatus TaxID=210409 RepID=A0A5B7DAV6_PORTR|nr:Mitotic checkpoint serine/threonine-protein kinase BUB1 [Portunus trituberculatus]
MPDTMLRTLCFEGLSLQQHPPNVTTEKFTCCEMKDGQPWTYQTDYYGAAAIAHLFLFGTYMDLKKTASGKWSITGVFKRQVKSFVYDMMSLIVRERLKRCFFTTTEARIVEAVEGV